MRSIRLSAIIALTCLLGWQVSSVKAAGIPWANPNGSSPGFFNWANGQNQTGLMGSPTAIGNTLLFLPQNFVANSINGQDQNAGATPGNPISQTTDRTDVDITAPLGFQIQQIRIFEAGDYQIVGSGGATKIDVAGGPVVTPLAPAVAPSLTDALHTNPAMPVLSGSNTWAGNASVTINTGPVTSVHLTLDNVLTAISTGGANPTSARVEKKSAGSSIFIQIIIPEPASFGLLACGAPLLLRRRRSV